MPASLLTLSFFLSMLNIECVLPVCKARVSTLDLGCQLEWKCPDANPKTTYTVQTKTSWTSWQYVSNCVRISRQSCNLSSVFPSLHGYNYIRLSSEEPDWMHETFCDPINDTAEFSPPSITMSMEDERLWVTVHFPCAPSITCGFEEKEAETHCSCPLDGLHFLRLSATVTLYNKHEPSDTQTRTAVVVEDTPFKEEFGFLIPGQVYCAVANFTSKGAVARASSPPSHPQCVYIPAKIESLIVVVVCGAVITLGPVIYLLWRLCESSERPLPKSLASLQNLELQNKIFIASSEAEPGNESSESDRISIVSFSDFILTDSRSLYRNFQSLGTRYYTTPTLHNPVYYEECAEVLAMESIDLETDGSTSPHHCFGLLWPSQTVLEAGQGCSDLDHSEETPSIPLSSVRVKREETSADDPEQYGDT
ncbi:uncharacterized protein si:dkeyp-75h12.7 [Myxocyprinus asiaticus]|uniref:uncharacterized protein si:dkeyp-75h12.7 n=1 Tax=Myxocyprinus asiaticus TaxID=70543 RepID=UPI002222C1D9|nr:uncharacterized protein si:dkeyp-75h12.7 [Myxocyprinus asiaticus]